MAAKSSSSKNWMYDVFLSFRGEDTRKSFTDHLYFALKAAGINTFRDGNELRRGEDIASAILKAIEESRISIVVFSRNYAASRWCLEELVKIMECRRSFRQMVLPIYYDVDPSDVRHQKGSFADAFARHEGRFVLEKVDSWRFALTEAADLSGWDLRNVADGQEKKFINKIVGLILRELNEPCLHVAKYPVGIDSHVQKMNLLLNVEPNEVCMVGILGMGGIGKTTIAKAIYNQLSDSFKDRCFLANVRETSLANGLVQLQEQLLSIILKTSKIKISSVDRGMDMIKEKLRNRRVLLILDDVDQLNQLNAIAKSRDWFGSGSIIIITTRDEHLLVMHAVDDTYTVNEMNATESMELFSFHAFGKSHLDEDYEELSKNMVAYCGGLPLALTVLGAVLFRKSITEWKSQLEKLRRIPLIEIQKKLEISFDALSDDNEKEVFLDIACFFVGMDKDYIVEILNGCGFFAEIGLHVLIQKCLVKVNESNKLMMHDLLRDMGREIVRRQSPNEPGRRSRLWHLADVVDTLTKEMGTKTIEGLALKLPKLNDMNVDANVFCDLRNLRLLQLNYVRLSGDCECPLKELRWLCWHGFPLKFIPNNFYQGNLVAIDMQYSNLRQVCKNSKILEKLKFLNLSHSHCLTQTPDFSKLPNLEELKLKDCKSLVEVHHSIGFLNRLVLVNFKDCKNLKSVPGSFCKLKSLKILNLSGCSNIDKLPEDLGDMESLTTLLADNTAIRQLPSSIVQLKNLKRLSLHGCKGLQPPSNSFPLLLRSLVSPRKSLNAINPWPTALQGLSRLKSLCLSDCNLSDGVIPKDLGNLSSLECLDLHGNNFGSLPNLNGLLKLEWLVLDNCTRLHTIPNLPKNLVSLYASNCKSLERLPDVSEFSNLMTVNVANCSKLIEAPGLSKSKSHKFIMMAGCYNIANIFKESTLKECFADIILPGNEIPDWFTYKDKGHSASFELPQFDDVDLIGFYVCAVCLSHLKLKSERTEIKLTNYATGRSISLSHDYDSVTSVDNHLVLGRLSNEGDSKMRSKDNLNVMVEVYGCNKTPITVKKIGVHLIYRTDKNYGEFVDGKIIGYTSRERKKAIVISEDEELQKAIVIREDEDLQKDETVVKAKRGLDNDYGAEPSSDHEQEAKKIRVYLPLSKCIVRHLSRSSDASDIVGMSSHNSHVLEMVGIGKIGKTSMDNRACCQFEDHCFMVDVIVKSEKHGASASQKELISKICSKIALIVHRDIDNLGELKVSFKKLIMHWLSYLPKSPPSNLCPENLVQLKMPCGNVEQLWAGKQPLGNLKLINLSRTSLTRVADLSEAQKLQSLNLRGCINLVEVSSIQYLTRLEYLNLKGCKSLRILPSMIGLKSLGSLNLSECSSLKNLPQLSTNVKYLYLSGTAIEELPPSIGHLSALVTLNLKNCTRLRGLPSCMHELKSLRTLNLSGCPNLLRHLGGTGTGEVPSSIGHHSRLSSPFLSNCIGIKSLIIGSICKLKLLFFVIAQIVMVVVKSFLKYSEDHRKTSIITSALLVLLFLSLLIFTSIYASRLSELHKNSLI